MKLVFVVLSFVFVASAAHAATLPGKDDLSKFVAGAGAYSRSFVTDIEDDNPAGFCELTVKIDLAVNVAQKNITYVATTVGTKEELSEQSQTVKVGKDSLSYYDAMYGTRVYSVNGVNRNAVVMFERIEISSLGHKGRWKAYKTLIEFTPGKVKIGDCTYRRIQNLAVLKN